MPIRVVEKFFDGAVVVLQPDRYEDHRGWFMESYRMDYFEQLGLPTRWVQDNHSRSRKGVVRGLHFQWDPPMGKLMRVVRGEAFLVAVDLRVDSPTFGKWVGINASEENRLMVWAPASFARGFAALSDVTEVEYKCTGIYNPEGEGAIRWDDPDIGINWPVEEPILSEKDRNAMTLKEWLQKPESRLFTCANPG